MNILILNQQVLAIDPQDTGDSWQTEDQVIPKHVVPGAALVTVDSLPADYAPGRYTYDNGFIPVSVAVAVPQFVKPLDAIILLDSMGLGAAYKAYRDSPARTLLEQETLLRAEVWERNNPILIAAATAMGLTSEQLDQMFIQIGY